MISHGQTDTGRAFDFGKRAQDYDRWYTTPEGQAHDRVQKADVRHFLGPATSGMRLLDIGCGTGHWSGFFASLGYNVAGVDVAPEMIQVAHNRTMPGVATQVADARFLPFQDASFDVAATMTVLEFLPEPATALREMARCIKMRGRMLIGCLNRFASINQQRLAEGREPYISGQLFSPDELAALLRPFGKVRMIASEPGNGRNETASKAFRKAGPSRTELTGPLIIAEVQR
ncbi:MAG: class I SAM-dependent methyltransferase [Candidatus Hydrogenedentota bacterium]